VGQDDATHGTDLGESGSKIFFRRGLDRANQLDLAQQIALLAQWICFFAKPFTRCARENKPAADTAYGIRHVRKLS
jgi:hypothetical protein